MTTTTAKKAQSKNSGDAPEHANLAAALAAFQADMPTVHKGQTARIPGKNGSTGYSYKYADLADVAKAAHPVLARHGLSFIARPSHVEGVGFVLVGVLRHSSGDESDEGMLPIMGRTAQEIGSSLTYNRRYLLGCMTGIVTDEDDDGAAANNARDARPQAQPVTQPPPAEQAGGTRQQGRAPEPAAQGAPDSTVVKAHTIAATRATNLDALRETWQQAVAAGTFGSSIVDPDDGTGEAPHITLGEFLMRKRTELEQAAAA